MKDPKSKIEMIRHIESLQLSDALIVALEDTRQAESIAEAVQFLQGLSQQWNWSAQWIKYSEIEVPWLDFTGLNQQIEGVDLCAFALFQRRC